MKKTIVSVLIPVYNVETYLENCLESVIKQTLTDIEIICVNDGSTDGSLEILKKYKEKDSRIKIITKENGGLPSARNAGLDHAKGKYVGFVDADDYIEKNMFERLVKIAEEDEAEIVVCGANIFPETPRADGWLYECLSPEYKKYKSFEPEILFIRNDVTPFLWRTLIRRDLIESRGFRLDEDIIIGEDKAFQCKVFPEAKRITVIPDKLYNYFWCRPNSLMGKQVYGKLENKAKAHAKLVYNIGMSLTEKNISDKEKENIYEAFLEWSIPFIYDDFIYLSLAEKHLISMDVIDIWKRVGIYRYYSSLPQWKKDAFEYISSLKKVNEIESNLSVIIPLEYSSRYVDEMLERLKGIQNEKLEIIFINNGCSNENYLKIQKFLYSDYRVRLFNTPKHNSYAESLNIGVKLAHGKYIAFLDVQDWFQSSYDLESWLECALQSEADICLSFISKKNSPIDLCEVSCAIEEGRGSVWDLDYHNALYLKEFLNEQKIEFVEASILTGYVFWCKTLSATKKIKYYTKSVYKLREYHRADWISTEKCEQVLAAFNELIDLSLETNNAYLHGKIFSMLNGDKIKQLIINNTKMYCMPSWQCPNGENSQINTVKSLFEIIGKANENMLYYYGYEETDSIFGTLYEVVKMRHQFLSELSSQCME